MIRSRLLSKRMRFPKRGRWRCQKSSRPLFQVLVMSEESRLGREAIETAYALKQIVQAGIRVFFYLEDRERTLDSHRQDHAQSHDLRR